MTENGSERREPQIRLGALEVLGQDLTESILGLAVIAMFSFSWTVEGLLKDHAVAVF